MIATYSVKHMLCKVLAEESWRDKVQYKVYSLSANAIFKYTSTSTHNLQNVIALIPIVQNVFSFQDYKRAIQRLPCIMYLKCKRL